VRGTTKLGVFAGAWALVTGFSFFAAAFEPDRDGDGYPDYGGDACPDLPATPKVKGPAPGCPVTAKFTGFSVTTDGASAVFVRLSGTVPVEVSQGERWVSFLIRGAWVDATDSWSPPSGSGASLERAVLLRDAEGVRLNLRLKTRTNVNLRLVQQTDGLALAVEIP
jgi:hypothetical protein